MSGRILVLLLLLIFGRSRVIEGQPATIFLLHGRGQAGKDVAQLEASWRAALHQGMRDASLTPIADAQIKFVVYKDIFEPGGEQYYCPEGAYAAGGLTEALRRGIRILADGLARIEGVATAVALERLKDTREFLTQGRVRCAVNGRLVTALESSNGGRVLVAHSMGGLISLNVLSGIPGVPGTPRVDALITIGSQLRIQEMVAHLSAFGFAPYRVPAGFGRWTDFSGVNDYVSPGNHVGVWRVTSDSRIFRSINTGTSEAHAATSYLANPDVARALHAEWCAASGTKEAGCD